MQDMAPTLGRSVYVEGGKALPPNPGLGADLKIVSRTRQAGGTGPACSRWVDALCGLR